MAIIAVYDLGDMVKLTGALADSAGVVVDPSTLVVTVKAPDGTETEYTYGSDAYPVRSAAGLYYVDITPDQVGDWYYKFKSTGTGQAADDGMFRVKTSLV